MFKKKYHRLYNYPWENEEENPSLTKYCEWPNCNSKGSYPAPRSRDNLRNFKWFCLNHVKAYNKSWDYFKGQSQTEIEEEISDDATWHRPTWNKKSNKFEKINDKYGFFKKEAKYFNEQKKINININKEESGKLNNALKIFGLCESTHIDEIKKTYKLLVKKFHPDKNQGKRSYIEKLIEVNNAYSILVEYFDY